MNVGRSNRMCRSENTEDRGEKIRPYRVLIAVVTIYSVERHGRRERGWSLARKDPAFSAPISPLEIKREIQFYLSLVLTPRHEGRADEARSEIPAPGLISAVGRTRDNFEHFEKIFKEVSREEFQSQVIDSLLTTLIDYLNRRGLTCLDKRKLKMAGCLILRWDFVLYIGTLLVTMFENSIKVR